jgi:hypothetical protein
VRLQIGNERTLPDEALLTDAADLREARAFFRDQRPEAYLDRVLAMARVWESGIAPCH